MIEIISLEIKALVKESDGHSWHGAIPCQPCGICKALVLSEDKQQHEQWHVDSVPAKCDCMNVIG